MPNYTPAALLLYSSGSGALLKGWLLRNVRRESKEATNIHHNTLYHNNKQGRNATTEAEGW